MRPLHGPFENVSAKRRDRVREPIRDGIKMGTCDCGICERRRKTGLDPHPYPERPMWVRMNPPGEKVPLTERPVYLVDRRLASDTREGA